MENFQKNLTPRVTPFKVTGTGTDQLATYDFLLVIHSNHGLILYHFRNKRQFQSIITNFPAHMNFNVPPDGVPLSISQGL